MFPLPQAPTANVAPGVTGGGSVNTNIPPGSLPYRPSIPAEAMQGVSSFMQNFMQMRQASREMNKQKFLEGVQFHQSTGIPISDQDGKKLMQYAKRGGLDYLPTEPPTQQEQDYAQAQQQQQQQQEAMGRMLASPNSLQASAALSPTGVLSPEQQQTADTLAAGPGPGQPPPTFMQRVGNALGLRTPQVSMQSPMGQWLQNLSQASQIGGGLPGDIAQQRTLSNLEFGFEKQFGYPLKGMTAEKEMQLIGLTRQAMSGSPDAIHRMAQMSNGWQLPMDELEYAMRKLHPEMDSTDISRATGDLYLKLKMGYPQYQLKMLDMGKDLAQYFQNDPKRAIAYITGQPGADAPQLSPQQVEQTFTAAKQLWDNYPTVQNTNIPTMYAMSFLQPNGADTRNSIMNYLSATDAKGRPLFPRAGSIAADQFNRTLGKDYYGVNASVQTSANQLAWSQMKGILDRAGDDAKPFWDTWNNPKATTQARAAAGQELSKIARKFQGVTIKFNGKDVPVGDPFQMTGGYNYLFGETHAPLAGLGPYFQPLNQGDPAASMRQNQDLVKRATGTDPVMDRFAAMSLPERQATLESLRNVLDPATFAEIQRQALQLPIPAMYGPTQAPPYKPTGIGSLENR